MIAFAGFSPQKQSAEMAVLQRAAVQNWLHYFDQIYLFGDPEPDLTFPKVVFEPAQYYPPDVPHAFYKPIFQRIGQLRADTLCACISSDTQLGSLFAALPGRLATGGYAGGSSRRLTFNADQGFESAILDQNDQGLNIFVAYASIWEHAGRECPEKMRVGRAADDTWISGFMNVTCGMRFVDFTPMRCVYHPRHEFRRHGNHEESNMTSCDLNHNPFALKAGEPSIHLT